MGVYFHVYAGPVLVCKYHYNDVVTKKTKTVNRCTNGHKDKSKSKFCPQCGQPFTQYQEETESTSKKKSVDNIYDTMSEGGFREDVFDLCWGGLNNEEVIEDHDVFAPTGEYLDRKTHLETREFALHFRGNLDTAQECAKCEEFYAKEIAYLRTKYDSVTVEWVMLTEGS